MHRRSEKQPRTDGITPRKHTPHPTPPPRQHSTALRPPPSLPLPQGGEPRGSTRPGPSTAGRFMETRTLVPTHGTAEESAGLDHRESDREAGRHLENTQHLDLDRRSSYLQRPNSPNQHLCCPQSHDTVTWDLGGVPVRPPSGNGQWSYRTTPATAERGRSLLRSGEAGNTGKSNWSPGRSAPSQARPLLIAAPSHLAREPGSCVGNAGSWVGNPTGRAHHLQGRGWPRSARERGERAGLESRPQRALTSLKSIP